MLAQPSSKIEKQDILDRQGKRYRADYLPRVHALPGVRALFEYLKATAIRVALGTIAGRTNSTTISSVPASAI